MAEVDNLYIKIESDANSASAALDTLIDKLGKVSEAIQNCNAGKVGDGVGNQNSDSQVGEGNNIRFDSKSAEIANELFTKMNDSLSNFGNSLENVSNRFSDAFQSESLEAAAENISRLAEGADGASDNLYDLADAANSAGDGIRNSGNEADETTSRFGGLGRGILGLIARFSGLPKMMGIIRQMGSALGGAFTGNTSGLRSFTAGLNGGFKTVLRYAFGIRSTFVLLNKLRTAFKEGCGNLAQYSGAFNSSLAQMQGGLTTVKNSLATAFAPIIQVIAPLIQTFCNLLASAANAMGSFLAALTGHGFTVKAVSVVQDYAKGVGGVGKAAGGAAKQAKELNKQLSVLGFDELNQLQDSKDSGSGGGGGGGGGAGGGVGGMFETTEIDSGTKDLAQRLKDEWSKSLGDMDFEWFGDLIGNKIKSGLEKVNSHWGEIENTAKKIATFLSTTINGIVKVDGLPEEIGKSIAGAINTAFGFAAQFRDRIDTRAIGEFLSKSLYNTLINIDAKDVGMAISGVIKNGINLLTGFIEGISWKDVPRKLVDGLCDFLSGVDFIGIATALARLIGAAIGATANLVIGISELVSDIYGKIRDEFTLEKAKSFLKSVGTNLLNAIISALADAADKAGFGFIADKIRELSIPDTPDAKKVNQFVGKTKKSLESGFGSGKGIVAEVEPQTTKSGSELKDQLVNEWDYNKKPLLTEAEMKKPARSLYSDFARDWQGASAGGLSVNNVLLNGGATQFANYKKEFDNASKGGVSVNNNLKNKGSKNYSDWKKEFNKGATDGVSVKNGLNTTGTKSYGEWSSAWKSSSKNGVTVSNGLSTTGGAAWTKFSGEWGNKRAVSATVNPSTSGFWSKASNSIGSHSFNATVNPSVSKKLSMSDLINKNSAMKFIISGIAGILSNAVGHIKFAARGGIVDAATLFGGNIVAGEAGKEAIIPLERDSSMQAIANAIVGNMVGSGQIIANAVERGVAMAMMNNRDTQPQQINVYSTLYTESDEVLARAVSRGNTTLAYRNGR